MLGIELEARDRGRRFVTGGREQLAHLVAEVVLAQHEARGGLPQPPADADLVDTLAQHLLHALQERLLLAVLRLDLGLAAVRGARDRARRGARPCTACRRAP